MTVPKAGKKGPSHSFLAPLLTDATINGAQPLCMQTFKSLMWESIKQLNPKKECTAY